MLNLVSGEQGSILPPAKAVPCRNMFGCNVAAESCLADTKEKTVGFIIEKGDTPRTMLGHRTI